DRHTQIVVCKAGVTWSKRCERRSSAMTFNEGMQIDTSTTSTSGGGRGPGRGMAIGGGFGGLIIVVIALLLGVNPSSVIPQDQGYSDPGVEAPGFDLSQCKTGQDANNIVQCRVVATGNS